MNYYAFERNHTSGPYSLEELRAKLERGELTASDQVCPQGTEAWQALGGLLAAGTASEQKSLSQIPPLPVRPPRRKLGCGGCLLLGLAFFSLLVVGLIGTSYYILLHTPLPLQWAGNAVSGPNFQIEGIAGSVASGFSIASVHWRADNGDTGDAENIKLDYSGFFEFARRQELVLKELSVGKLNLVVSSTSTDMFQDSANAPSRPSTTLNPVSGNENSLKLFRIDRIRFGNVHIKNSRTGFELTMPEFDYSGLQLRPDSIDLGNLRIASDRLDVVTRPGPSVQIEGKTVNFQKSLEGTIKPLLHPMIKQPISFALDIGTSAGGKPWANRLFYRLTAVDGKLDAYLSEAGEGNCRIHDLALLDYLAIPQYDLPSHLTVDALLTEHPESLPDPHTILTGRFTLGVIDFQIQPERTVAESKDGSVRYEFQAVHPTADGEIRVIVQFRSTDHRIQPSFTSTPALPPAELLSQVFYGKSSTDLTPAEKKQTNDRVPVYFPAAPPAAEK